MTPSGRPRDATVDPDAVAAHRADLDALVELFATNHVAPVDLAPAIPDRTVLASLSDDEFLAAVMVASAGRPRDGHSGVFPLAQPELRLWPVQLYSFEDGWRVVAATPDHADLVGREVTAIGGLSPDEAAALVAPLVPRDNDASLTGRLPQYLTVPSVLAGVGIEPGLELDGELVTIDPVAATAYAEAFDLFDPLVCPPLPRAGPLWTVEEHDDAVAVRWGRVVFHLDDRSHREFVDEVAASIAATTPRRVVLDLRDNPGGELPANEPLVGLLQEVAGDRPLVILVNRCTFSAAALMASELLTTTDATLVGEPMGGAPGLWADARVHRLPESGVAVHVASGAYGDLDLPAETEPDVAIEVLWDDHEAGRDPALAAALER